MSFPIHRSISKMPVPFLLSAMIVLMWTGCGDGDTTGPEHTGPEERIYAVHEENRAAWLGMSGVVGTGIAGCDGGLCIEIYVGERSDELEEQFPSSVEGYSVRFRVMDIDSNASILDVHEEYLPIWLSLPGVAGSGVGRCEGEPCFIVYLAEDTEEAEYGIPAQVEGYTIRKVVSGRFIFL